MRFSAVELRRFFFKPVEFYLELADFLIQAVLFGRRLRCARRRLGGKHPREALQQLLLPLAHLHRVDLVLRRNGVDRLDALQGLKSNFRFEFRVMLASFRGHFRDRISGLDLTIRPVQFSGATSESHKGFLTLTTRPGRGTTFRAYFPAEVEAGASKAKSECPGGFQGNGELVLVVDDESYIRELATTILSKNGYRAISAKDGAQALAMFSMHGCDISVVLTDLSMPNLDGASLTRVVRELNPDVRVLVMSGQNSSARAGQIGALAAAFIAKPFKPQTLLENVNALLHPAAA